MSDLKEKTLAQWEQINRASVRRFGDNSFAEEAALAVMEGIQENNWQRVRAYGGKSTFTTYLRAITLRLLEDFSRSRFGRVRPPLWVKTLGGIWGKLFIALCLERLAVSDAVEVVAQNQITVEKKEIEEAAYELLARIIDCGTDRGLEVSYSETDHVGSETIGSGQSDYLEENGRDKMLHHLFQCILGEEHAAVSKDMGERFDSLDIQLQPEEKILLKLSFQDGLNVTAAGRFLGLTRYQAHGKMNRMMKRIRTEFERTGMDQEILAMLRP